MKKNLVGILYPREKVKKLLIMTKFCLLFVLLSIQLQASVYSQQNKITLKFDHISAKKLFVEIEKLSDYAFVYKLTDVDPLKDLSVNFNNTEISKILDHCLKGTDLGYKIVNKHIIIIRNDKKKDDKQKEIKGRVVDKNGDPLPGVTIIIKGTKVGTATDSKGQFKIPAEVGNSLVFSFIGMQSKEVKIKDLQKPINVKLLEDEKQLDEVVVTGYGNIKKESFTGNATVVSKTDLIKVNSHNVISALQVYDPSFRIQENNSFGSDPNNLPVFNIRGQSSIGKSSNLDLFRQGQRTNLKNNPNLPMFVMDGFEISVEKLYDMDMNRIKNITILKDAAATALYGSKAANGVVLITTVAPKEGELEVNYNLNVSCQFPDLSDYNLCDAREKLEIEKLTGLYSSEDRDEQRTLMYAYNNKLQEILRGVDTDWMSQPLEDAINHRHSIYVEGGTGHIRYGVDLNFDNNDGVMKGSFRDRKGVGFKLDYNYEGLRLRNNITYGIVESENSKFGNFYEYSRMCPYFRLYDANHELIPEYEKAVRGTIPNPLYKTLLDSYSGRGKQTELIENLNIEYNILKEVKLTTQISFTKNDSDRKSFNDPNDPKYRLLDREERGELNTSKNDDYNYSLKFGVQFNKSINNHYINGTLSYDMSGYKTKSYNTIYKGFQIGSLQSPYYAEDQPSKTDYRKDESRNVGFISRINYSYDNIYLCDASLKYDGSSKFGANKRFAPFWSIGLGLNVHNYEFMKSLNWLNRLKFRTSFGSLGKVSFPSYTAITSHSFFLDRWFLTGVGSHLQALGNEDLKWETTEMFNAAIDFSILNGRINGSFDYYNKKTVDLISDLYLRTSSGFRSYKINSGEILNEGFEMSINATVLRTTDMIFTAFANLGCNKNEIKKLSKAVEEYNNNINKGYDNNTHNDLMETPIPQYRIGESTTAIYAVRSLGIDPANGTELFLTKDGKRTHAWAGKDQVKVGDSSPDASGSFGFNVSYKGFYLNTSFLYQFGGQMYNSTIRDKVENVNVEDYNVDKRVLEQRWKQPGDIVPYLDIKENRETKPTSRFVQDNDFIAFNSMSLGYDFDKKVAKKLGMKKFGLRFNMNDIKRWSSIKTERGTYYPFARNFSMSLNMKF